jgi:putative ABC transport system permease protein
MSPPGRPKGEYRSAQREGTPFSADWAVLRAALGGALGRNRGRLALSVVVVALGVALGFAVALINEAAVAEFTSGMKTLSGVADLEVRGPRGGFDEALFARLARDPEIAVASPVVEVDARIAGRDEALRIYGVDAFRAAAVTPAFVGTADNLLDVLRPVSCSSARRRRRGWGYSLATSSSCKPACTTHRLPSPDLRALQRASATR